MNKCSFTDFHRSDSLDGMLKEESIPLMQPPTNNGNGALTANLIPKPPRSRPVTPTPPADGRGDYNSPFDDDIPYITPPATMTRTGSRRPSSRKRRPIQPNEPRAPTLRRDRTPSGRDRTPTRASTVRRSR